MTKWLDKLTSHDLSQFDAEGCNSIDEWIDRLDEHTPLEVITSSGTTGTLSILPKDKHGARGGMVPWKICLFQTFATHPTPAHLNPSRTAIRPTYPPPHPPTPPAPTTGCTTSPRRGWTVASRTCSPRTR